MEEAKFKIGDYASVTATIMQKDETMLPCDAVIKIHDFWDQETLPDQKEYSRVWMGKVVHPEVLKDAWINSVEPNMRKDIVSATVQALQMQSS